MRTARTRRGITLAETAKKIGTGVRAVADAEKGKPSTSATVYVALLWAYGMTASLDAVADPALDNEGQTLAREVAPGGTQSGRV